MLVDIGILIARVLFGAAIAAHGSQKLFGWFGGYGIQGTGGFFAKIGFRPGPLFAVAAGLGEFVGGLLLVLGLLTPAGSALVLSTMIVAMVGVHLKNGFFAPNGIETAYLYAAAAVSLAFTGGGAFSLDSKLGIGFVNQPYAIAGLLLLGVIGGAATLMMRQAQPQESAAQH